MKLLLIIAALTVTGCASSTLTIRTQPAGAYLTENGTSLAMTEPAVIQYQPEALKKNQNAKGCYIVKGWTATWASGAKASHPTIELCGHVRANYNITLSRPAGHAGLDKDLAHANSIQQNNNGLSAADAATLMLIGGVNQANQQKQKETINCTTTALDPNFITTNCR